MKMKLSLLSLALLAVSFAGINAAEYYPLIVNGTGQSVTVEATRGGLFEGKHKYDLLPGQAVHNMGSAGPQKFHAKTQGWDKEVTNPVVITPSGTSEIIFKQVDK